MSEPVTPEPTDDTTDVSPLQGIEPDRQPPVQPNPYMGGGEPPP